MRFASLGSGSRGNATLVEAGSTRLLVDCGFSVLETTRRLKRFGLEPTDLDGVLVTHEHADHIGGVERLARRHGLPVWMTHGTATAFGKPAGVDVRTFSCHQSFAVDEIEVSPFPVPHDAREPSQFVFSDGQRRLGILTDTGEITDHIVSCLEGCDGLVLECNHDENMLSCGPYSARLKDRVGGRMGHLSNRQAAGLLAKIDTGHLQHLVAAHLSDKNNRPDLVQSMLDAAFAGDTASVGLACQEDGFDWRRLD